MADVSQYFYICCSSSQDNTEQIKDNKIHIESQSESDQQQSSVSILKKPKESPSGLPDSNEVKQEKRLTLDLSHLASGQKDTLKESEELIRTKSAPVVQLKELQELI